MLKGFSKETGITGILWFFPFLFFSFFFLFFWHAVVLDGSGCFCQNSVARRCQRKLWMFVRFPGWMYHVGFGEMCIE